MEKIFFSFPMEMHLVHYNMKYPDITTALSFKDGLAVLGVMFDVSLLAYHFP